MSKKQEIILLTGDGWGLEVPTAAQRIKDDLLAASRLITAVSDQQSSSIARAQVGTLADIRIAVEKTRKTVKEPVLELGQRIDAAAKDYIGQLVDEEKRLTKLVGDHAAAVDAERRTAELARQAAERERLRLEILEQQRAKAVEMERIRLGEAAEKARKLAEEALFAGQDDEAEDAARAEAHAAAEKAKLDAVEAGERARAEAAKAAADALASAVLIPRQAEGVKFEIDFEITNLATLYKGAPNLVDLTPKRAAILAELKFQRDQGFRPGLPGLIVTQKAIISKK